MSLARSPGGSLALVQELSAALVAALACAGLLALSTTGTGLAAWGLLLAPALATGAVVGLGRGLGIVPDGSSARAALAEPALPKRLTVWAVLLSVGWLAAGQVSLWILGKWAESPRVAGVLLALSVLGLWLALAFVADLVIRRLEAHAGIARLCAAFGHWGLLIPLGVLALGIGLPVALGETSGQGHALALMGVFRRPELDLRPLLELLLLALCALSVGGTALRARRILVWVLPVVLGSCILAAAGARHITARQATVLTRQGGLAPALLGVLSRLADDDGDGAPAEYGGGDCDDDDADVFPGAPEAPGSGRDLDCDGQIPPPQRPTAAKLTAMPVPGARSWPQSTNVLLLTVDTLRFDLGFTRMGPPGRLSPRLDQLAKRCLVYERAYSLASYTSKSLAPMLMGKYSSETARSFEHFDRFGKTETFLQERLQQAGRRTVSTQAYWYFFLEGYGFERGWDVLDHEAAPKRIAVDGDASVTGEKLADRTIVQLTELDSHSGRFFAWAHWVDPHSEYVPHPEFDLGASPRERYDGEVAYVDHQIGRVLDALAARPFAERTALLITSDHGEAFGEHGMIRHGFELWEELVRVPLLLCLPGGSGRRIQVPRSLIDLAPTVLELLDVPAPAAALSGVSLLADVAATVPPARPVLVDMPRGPNNQERRAFLSGTHKLITSAGRVIGLYDLAADPGEKTDLSGDAELAERLTAEMKAFVSQLHVRAPG